MTQNARKTRLEALAKCPFPPNAINQDAQTLLYGSENSKFLQSCEVDLNLSKLNGFGFFAFHLTPQAYGILVARTLLKYFTLLSGTRKDAETALDSSTLSCFLALFSTNANSSFLKDTMSFFDDEDIATLKECAEEILKMEMAVFDRDQNYLGEVENLILWLNTHYG